MKPFWMNGNVEERLENVCFESKWFLPLELYIAMVAQQQEMVKTKAL